MIFRLLTFILLFSSGTLRSQDIPISAPLTGIYHSGERTDSSLRVAGPKDTAWILPTPIVSVKDYQEVSVTVDKNGSCSLNIVLTEKGKQELAAATKNANGKKLAFILSGILEMNPTIVQEISGGKLTITGNFSRGQLEDLQKNIEKEMKGN